MTDSTLRADTGRMTPEGYCAICGKPTRLTITLPAPSLPEVTHEGREYRCEDHGGSDQSDGEAS